MHHQSGLPEHRPIKPIMKLPNGLLLQDIKVYTVCCNLTCRVAGRLTEGIQEESEDINSCALCMTSFGGENGLAELGQVGYFVKDWG